MTRQNQTNLEHDICDKICPIAAAMVGVCMTVIGLIRVVISISKADTFVDDLLSADAVLFLVATLTSYFAMRSRSVTRLHWLERVADFSFIAGMVLMTAICVFITYFIAK